MRFENGEKYTVDAVRTHQTSMSIAAKMIDVQENSYLH